jgi:hypothetical protein
MVSDQILKKLELEHDNIVEHNNKLQKSNIDLNNNIDDAGNDSDKLKTLVIQL